MRLLVVGGSGHVGEIVLPHLVMEHTVCVFDLAKPRDGKLKYIAGDVCDFRALSSAMMDVDAVVYMAMNSQTEWGGLRSVETAFDVNAKGLYFALWAAVENKVPHLVYTSSMSVYRARDGRYPDESHEPDATEFYGLTKRLGEEVCRSWTTDHNITVTALRLCFPIADDSPAPTEPDFKAATYTRAKDVSNALCAALSYRRGFEVFAISGDTEGNVVSTKKAQELLAWQASPRSDAG